MKRTSVYIISLVMALACLGGWRQISRRSLLITSSTKLDASARVQLNDTYGSLPLSFEANRGQADKKVRFLSRGSGYTLFLTPAEAVLALRQPSSKKSPDAVLRMRLVGANPSPRIVGAEELSGRSSYFVGSDPGRWRNAIPNYARVRYQQIFPGVDLVFYGNQGQLEYDFVVAPGADPRRIKLAFSGAQRLRLENGDVVARIAGGDLRLHQPVLYQERHGKKVPVGGNFILTSNREVAFKLGAYDRRSALVIDPSLVYSSYLGGSHVDQGLALAVDAQGNAYITGSSSSANFPTTNGALQKKARNAGGTAFVLKLNTSGTGIVYATFLGGSNTDVGRAIAVNQKGEASVAGSTLSQDFPTTPGALQAMNGGGQDSFIAKLSADGSGLLYSTYLGGGGDEEVRGLALDKHGNAHIVGVTGSSNFPTTAQAFQRAAACAGGQTCSHAFISKLNPGGSALLYSSYLGGTGNDSANAIALDLSGAAYVAGHTNSPDFPVTSKAQQRTPGTHSACANAGRTCSDAFVSKFSTGGALLYSTFLGGSGEQRATALAVDTAGAAYIAGHTDSQDFPVSSRAFQNKIPNHGPSAFVTKLNALGVLEYSTYLGGGGDEASAIAVDEKGRAYVAGGTASAIFPTSSEAFQRRLVGIRAAFWSRLDEHGSAAPYSTLLSGSGSDVATAIAIDSQPNTTFTWSATPVPRTFL